jgi:GAF domain-containing protein
MRLRQILGPPTHTLAVALLTAVLVSIAAPPLVALLTDARLHASLAALIASATFVGGLTLGAAIDTADERETLGARINELESRTDLDGDTRFHRHPKASPERGYRSIVSVPLWRSGQIAGVLNVIATRRDAFSPIDRTYVTLLASVIDVAESVRQPPSQAY